MKNYIWKSFLFCLLLGFTASCSDDKEDLTIQPGEGTQADISMYADELDNKLTFQAPDAWAASVAAGTGTRAASLDWIALGATSGEAGSVELPLLINKNRTGEDRVAVISIYCGSTLTQFTIKQLGIKKDGSNGYQPLPDIMLDDEKPATIEPTFHFVANEDWFGHRPGSITRFFWDGRVDYPAYANANQDTGLTLGNTTQFAMNWGGNLYMMSKQDYANGARLAVADQKTLKSRASLRQIGGGDGRAACGVDAHTVYVGTSSNIQIFDIDKMEIVGVVQGMEDGGEDLYNGQTGDMVRSGDCVYVAIQNKGIAVIDCATNKFIKTLGDGTNSGVCASRDGFVWAAGNPILKIDPRTQEVVGQVELPAGCSGGKVGWGAWRPTSLCASVQHNVIYWNESGFGLCSYDIDNDKLTTNVMSGSSYGTGRIEPVHDYFVTASGNIYTLQGSPVQSYTLNVSYLFQSHPLFEDANKPVILTNQILLRPGESRKICLSDMAYDADDASKLMLKTLDFTETNADLAAYEVKNYTLYLKAGDKEGYTIFGMKVCSRGVEAEKSEIQILVKEEDTIQ